MAWTTTTRVDSVLRSSTLRQKLFSVDGSYSASAFAQAEAEARARLVAYMQYAGYSDPGATLEADSTTEAYLASACQALMLQKAFAQGAGIKWPVGLEDEVKQILSEFYDRRLPIPGLTPSTEGGYGGVTASETSELIDGSRPQRLSRDQLKTW